MNGKERFAKAMDMTDLPDRVPVAPLFQAYWALDAFGVTVPESIADPMKAVEAIKRGQEACTFDALEVVWDWFAFLDMLGCKSNIAPAGSPTIVYSPLQSIDEAAKLEQIDTGKNERVKASLVTGEALLAEFADDFYCCATMAMPFTLAGHMRDAARLMSDMIRHPDAVHQLLDYCTQLFMRHFQLYIDLGIQAFMICDPSASGNLLSPRHYEEFVEPYTKPLIQMIHDAGLPTILHICGDTTKILPIVARMAPTAFSFDHAVDAAVCKQVIGDSVCVIGNLDPADTLLDTVDTVRDAAVRCVDACKDDGGFVLAAGCDLSIGTPVENINAMIDVGHQATY
jgi:MtaA/CmuA family methyltransferase